MRLRTLSIVPALIALSFFNNGCNEANSQDKPAAHAHAAAPNLPPSPTKRPADAKLYIISPKDGDTVGQTVTVQFGLKGMGVAPAATYVNAETPTGHHHIVLDAELPNLKLPFPKDENYLHFGGGQTEASLKLTPGKHTLQLVLGDHNHFPHDPPLISDKITITVK